MVHARHGVPQGHYKCCYAVGIRSLHTLFMIGVGIAFLISGWAHGASVIDGRRFHPRFLRPFILSRVNWASPLGMDRGFKAARLPVASGITRTHSQQPTGPYRWGVRCKSPTLPTANRCGYALTIGDHSCEGGSSISRVGRRGDSEWCDAEPGGSECKSFAVVIPRKCALL